MTEITIDNKPFFLDVEKAREAGLLKCKRRPVEIKDIPNGSIFKWRASSGMVYTYVMLNNKLNGPGQTVSINDVMYGDINYFDDDHEIYSYYNPKNNEWITEVQD